MSRRVLTIGLVGVVLLAAIPIGVRFVAQSALGVHAAVADPNVVLGADQLNEPFNCWTDGPYSVFASGGKVYAANPPNSTAEHSNRTGV